MPLLAALAPTLTPHGRLYLAPADDAPARGVDGSELIARAGTDLSLARKGPVAARAGSRGARPR